MNDKMLYFRCLCEPFCPAPAFVTANGADSRNPLLIQFTLMVNF
jgi:hypothetical protein